MPETSGDNSSGESHANFGVPQSRPSDEERRNGVGGNAAEHLDQSIGLALPKSSIAGSPPDSTSPTRSTLPPSSGTGGRPEKRCNRYAAEQAIPATAGRLASSGPERVSDAVATVGVVPHRVESIDVCHATHGFDRIDREVRSNNLSLRRPGQRLPPGQNSEGHKTYLVPSRPSYALRQLALGMRWDWIRANQKDTVMIPSSQRL